MDAERERQLLRSRLLGFGLAAEPVDPVLGSDPLGRDLRVDGAPGERDLVTVSDVSNLAQSLQVALTTRLGDDVFNASFGFDGLNALVEETNPVMARERVRVAVIHVLRRDSRVRKIVDLQLEGAGAPLGEGDQLERTRGSRTLEVRVVFETVSGEELTVGLQGAVGA